MEVKQVQKFYIIRTWSPRSFLHAATAVPDGRKHAGSLSTYSASPNAGPHAVFGCQVRGVCFKAPFRSSISATTEGAAW